MEQINYERLIPTEPQEDVVSFALQNGAFQYAQFGSRTVGQDGRWRELTDRYYRRKPEEEAV